MTVAAYDLFDSMEGIVFMTAADGTIPPIGKRNWNRFALENDGGALLDGRSVTPCSTSSPGTTCATPTRGSSPRCVPAGPPRPADEPLRQPHHPQGAVDRYYPGAAGQRGRRRVLVQSLTVSETVRPPLGLFVQAMLDRPRRDKALPILAMCSYCQDVRYLCGSSERDSTLATG